MFGSGRTKRTIAGAMALVTIGVSAVALQAGAANSVSSSFVAVAPCRLFDFRPDPGVNVGPRKTALGPNQSQIIKVTGNQGKCTGIPTNATAVSMNLTGVAPTAGTFVSVTPGDETARPTTSNLNLVAGNPPVPNKVDVKLDAKGQIRTYNRFGSVFLIGDVVGFYVPATGGGGTGPQGPAGPAGPQGPAGPAGPAGDDAAVEITYASTDFNTTGLRTTASVSCPAGTVAIGGSLSGPNPIFAEIGRPVDVAGTGWEIRVNRGGTEDKPFNVTAVCATATIAP